MVYNSTSLNHRYLLLLEATTFEEWIWRHVVSSIQYFRSLVRNHKNDKSKGRADAIALDEILLGGVSIVSSVDSSLL